LPPRVALVTGSGKKRIGWHVAEALARRHYAVALHYHTSAAEAESGVASLRALGASAEAFAADVSDPAQAYSLVDRALERFGRIDVLVTCAAVWSPRRLEEVTPHDLQRNLAVNLGGTFFCAQRAGLAMARQPEGGCIVTFGDWAVSRPYLDYAAYFAAKGAIATLTRALAVELGTRNPRVRVNCVEPGPAMVPDNLPEDERRRIVASTLTQREGAPRDVVAAVLFLIENEYTTGVCLPVDGGRSIYADPRRQRRSGARRTCCSGHSGFHRRVPGMKTSDPAATRARGS
jgi:pteridine reductase